LKKAFSSSRTLGKLQFREHTLGAITAYGFEPFVILIIAVVIFCYVGLRGYDIVEIIFLVYLLLSAMKMMLATQQSTRKLLSSWGSIEVLNTIQKELEESKERIPRKRITHKVPLNKSIRFENVSFNFNNGVKVLEKINLEIPPNSTVAFVGESGAGKTTLVNLLIGLLRPTEGIISIGEIPYHNIDPHQIREKVGYMTQEDVIFNDTIYNNITLWNSNGLDKDNMEMVKSATNKAHVGEFIQNLKNGYDSVLGEGGINISGGQRQRICIARELYKDAKILIFDEATSSLDTKTEKEIQQNIDEFKGQKTIVIVAHRLSTVRNSDKIYVLKDGTIVEEGSYEELYNSNGEFTRMVIQQNH
jgi:subfamily B ATP-binding cassette protein MsbA